MKEEKDLNDQNSNSVIKKGVTNRLDVTFSDSGREISRPSLLRSLSHNYSWQRYDSISSPHVEGSSLEEKISKPTGVGWTPPGYPVRDTLLVQWLQYSTALMISGTLDRMWRDVTSQSKLLPRIYLFKFNKTIKNYKKKTSSDSCRSICSVSGSPPRCWGRCCFSICSVPGSLLFPRLPEQNPLFHSGVTGYD